MIRASLHRRIGRKARRGPLVLSVLVDLVAFVVRHPWLTASALAVSVCAHRHGRVMTAALIASVIALLLTWRWWWPSSYWPVVGFRLRAEWRRLWVYERNWQPAMVLGDLADRLDGDEVIPRLLRVRCDRWLDRVTVKLLRGQSPTAYARQADNLAHAFDARTCRVRVPRPGQVVLELLQGDPLVEPVAALDPASAPDVTAVPVGLCEDGRPWLLRLLGTHVLIAGVTGSGKGSVLWSLLRGLAPALRAGTVAAWVVDPKGGMELGGGERLFARFAVDADQAVQLLEAAVMLMQQRAKRLRGVTRQHEPTVHEPLVLVVVDEVATLTAYLPQRDLRNRCDLALSLLCTQGRSVGVNVVAALQDPRKEVLRLRNLFPTKVALRLDEPEHVDMVLGDGAREQGAVCDEIPESLPGVGYVRIDGVREPVRVRAAYVTDEDISAMCEQYAAPVRPVGLLGEAAA